MFISTMTALLTMWIKGPVFRVQVEPGPALLGFRQALGEVCNAIISPSFFLGLFVLLLLLRIVLRRQWLAVTCISLLSLTIMLAPYLGTRTFDLFDFASSLGLTVLLITALVRLGLLAGLTMIITTYFLWEFPFTTDFTRWHAGLGLIGLLAFAGLAGYGFWIALAGQPLFKDELAAAR